MPSKKIIVLLMSFIPIFALAFVTPSAKAQTFGVSLDTSGDISAESGLQRNHPGAGGTLVITVHFDEAVVLTVNDIKIAGLDSNGSFVPGVSIAWISPSTAVRDIQIGITVTAATTRVSFLIAAGIASANPLDDATSAGLTADIELLSALPGGGPTVYEISRIGIPVAITTAAEFKVSILLSEPPVGGFTPGLINASGADIKSVVALATTPATAARPATWRDGLLHGCVVTLTTRPGQNAVVISVNSFAGLDGATYTPPSNPVEGVHILTVGTQRAALAQTAGLVVNIPPGKRILDFLVIATNIAGSGIQVPPDSDASPPAAHLRTPAQMRYNVIEVAGLPNLSSFLGNGGKIYLASSDRLLISEIMSAAVPNSQWIEIKNNAGRQIVTGPNTHRLIFYQAHETPAASPAGIADRVGTHLVSWAPAPGTQTAISMYRVPGADGTTPAAWQQSTRPALNFDPNLTGNRIGSPGADPLGAPVQPATTTTPATTPAKTTQAATGTTPETTPETPPETTAGRVAGIVSIIEIVGAAERTGATVNEALDSPLLVQVLDLYDDGIANVRVLFEVTAGKGRVTSRGSGQRITRQTDQGGYTRVNFTPTKEGTATVEVSVNGLKKTVEFTISTGTTPATPTTTSKTTPGTTPAATPGTGSPAPTPVSPVVHVGAAKRTPMLWVSGGKIYALVGADVERFAPSVDNALSIAVGDDKVYWTEMTGENAGTINSANLNGDPGVAELKKITAVPVGIAVNTAEDKLYWTNSRGRIQSANLNGSGIKNVVQNLKTPMDIALSDDNAYWTQGNGSVRFVNLQGKKTIDDISTGAKSANSLTIADGKVYWTEKTGENAGTINSANLDGTGAKQLISIDAVPMGIAVDTQRENIYWTDSRGRIQSANLNGSVIQDVAEGLGSPGDMLLSERLSALQKTSAPTAADRATSDINGDSTVDDADAWLLIEAIGNAATAAKYDVNADGNVDLDDLQLVLNNRDKNAAAPRLLGNLKLTATQIARLEEQIELFIATGDRSPAAMRTLIYLQQLIATARPEKTQLLANYPNPFNPETWIPYELATDTNVRITIYNTQGVVIRTLEFGHQSAGYYTGRDRAAYWDGRNAFGEQVASGIYFYQLETDEISSMRKMVILK